MNLLSRTTGSEHESTVADDGIGTCVNTGAAALSDLTYCSSFFLPGSLIMHGCRTLFPARLRTSLSARLRISSFGRLRSYYFRESRSRLTGACEGRIAQEARLSAVAGHYERPELRRGLPSAPDSLSVGRPRVDKPVHRIEDKHHC